MIASPVSVLPTSSSGGQLFVYEYVLPGRRATPVHAVQAMKAVIARVSPASVIMPGLSPSPLTFRPYTSSPKCSWTSSKAETCPAVQTSVPVLGS